MTDIFDTSSTVSAVDGVVIVEGPGPVVYTMTPEAAADTSDKLLHAAGMAAGQRRIGKSAEQGKWRGV